MLSIYNYLCTILDVHQVVHLCTLLILSLSAWPEVRGTADTDGVAYSLSGQSSSYSLTTLSSPSSTDRRPETDMDGLKDADAGLRTNLDAV